MLKYISLGKYKSVFYSKGSNLHSSVIGGLFTIFFVLFFLVYGSLLFASILRRDNFELDHTARRLNAYVFTNTKGLTYESIQEC